MPQTEKPSFSITAQETSPIKFKYSEGEKVLCFHGPLIYEAKCLRTMVREKIAKYFVHYAGWNKNWDEWVPESRILRYTDQNIQKQKELLKAYEAQMKSKKALKAASRKLKDKESKAEKDKEKDSDSRSSTPSVDKSIKQKNTSNTSATSSMATQESDVKVRKKIKPDPTIESEEQYLTKVEIKIKLPEELKCYLVDDWINIGKNKKLSILPARNTVDQILGSYLTQKKSSKSITAEKGSAIVEVCSGIKEYFNVLLATQLLYKFERPQYAEILQQHPNLPPCEIYGGIHLLRLFVKLGPMLAYTALDEKCIQLLLSCVQDVLKYLLKNSSVFFSSDNYSTAPPEYLRKL